MKKSQWLLSLLIALVCLTSCMGNDQYSGPDNSSLGEISASRLRVAVGQSVTYSSELVFNREEDVKSISWSDKDNDASFQTVGYDENSTFCTLQWNKPGADTLGCVYYYYYDGDVYFRIRTKAIWVMYPQFNKSLIGDSLDVVKYDMGDEFIKDGSDPNLYTYTFREKKSSYIFEDDALKEGRYTEIFEADPEVDAAPVVIFMTQVEEKEDALTDIDYSYSANYTVSNEIEAIMDNLNVGKMLSDEEMKTLSYEIKNKALALTAKGYFSESPKVLYEMTIVKTDKVDEYEVSVVCK